MLKIASSEPVEVDDDGDIFGRQRINENDVLKVQLLKRFRLTEGGYRKRFKTGKLEQGETSAQFAERLKRNLEKRREMAGFEAYKKAYKK